jgi:hypothetical protein
MTDLVVTVARAGWPAWLAEGDLAGEPAGWSIPREWGFHVYVKDGANPRPPIEPGERLYIVAHNHVRGYSIVSDLRAIRGGWTIYRRHDCKAVTIAAPAQGFQGWKRRWWERAEEIPFPDWQTRGVWYPPRVTLLPASPEIVADVDRLPPFRGQRVRG